jgi:DNA-binding PadR family transcriptional regulator
VLHTKFDRWGRFTDPTLLILASLAGGAKHGHAIMVDIADFSAVRMEPGTLYGALGRLERQGWVEPVDDQSRRRPYRLTAEGQRELREQFDPVSHVAIVGPRRLVMA